MYPILISRIWQHHVEVFKDLHKKPSERGERRPQSCLKEKRVIKCQNIWLNQDLTRFVITYFIIRQKIKTPIVRHCAAIIFRFYVQDDLAIAIVENDLSTIEEIFGAYSVLYGDGDLSVGILHGYARGGGFYTKMLDFRYDIDQRTLAITINPDYSINFYSKFNISKQVIKSYSILLWRISEFGVF